VTPGFRPNPGYRPAEAEGRRVRVILNNGQQHDWPADGSHGCTWKKRGSYGYDIAEYQVL
jgi:hypothetical protein